MANPFDITPVNIAGNFAEGQRFALQQQAAQQQLQQQQAMAPYQQALLQEQVSGLQSENQQRQMQMQLAQQNQQLLNAYGKTSAVAALPTPQQRLAIQQHIAEGKAAGADTSMLENLLNLPDSQLSTSISNAEAKLRQNLEQRGILKPTQDTKQYQVTLDGQDTMMTSEQIATARSQGKIVEPYNTELQKPQIYGDSATGNNVVISPKVAAANPTRFGPAIPMEHTTDYLNKVNEAAGLPRIPQNGAAPVTPTKESTSYAQQPKQWGLGVGPTPVTIANRDSRLDEAKKLAGDTEKRNSDIIISRSGTDQLGQTLAHLQAYSTKGFSGLTGGTGPFATLGGLTTNLTEEGQQLASDFQNMFFTKVQSLAKDAGAKAIDSDAEKKTLLTTQPSMTKDDNVNRRLVIGAMALNERNKKYLEEKEAYINRFHTLDGFKSTAYDQSTVLFDPSQPVGAPPIVVPKSQANEAKKGGLVGVDRYIILLDKGQVGVGAAKDVVPMTNGEAPANAVEYLRANIGKPGVRDQFLNKYGYVPDFATDK